MIATRLIIKAVCDHFDVTHDDIRGKSRKGHMASARRVVVHFMGDRSNQVIAKAINRSESMASTFRYEMSEGNIIDREMLDHINQINLTLQEMTIKINRSQLGSLWEVLEMFLSRRPESVSHALLCLHLDDIKEKSRKRFLAGKENIGLDDKQVKAFQVWYFHFGAVFEEVHPHGHMTLIDIINQIKPTSNERTITIKN
jgi:hypothetical protein